MLANEWIDDEAAYRVVSGGATEDEDEDEIRYGLTPLGIRALDEGRAFSGFGPCAVAAQAPPSRRRSAARGRRSTPLFG